jgi:hypothetical protein
VKRDEQPARPGSRAGSARRGTVTVAGAAATMTSTTNFTGSASTVVGTNVVPIIATDFSNNKRTNNYQVVITNGIATTLKYDANGNLTNSYTSTKTNIYEWDAADRLYAIEIKEVGQVTKRSEFIYDGLGRRAQIIEKTNGVLQTAKRCKSTLGPHLKGVLPKVEVFERKEYFQAVTGGKTNSRW